MAKECSIIILQEINLRIKGRLAYNGKTTREWITKEDTASLNFSNQSTMTTDSVKAPEGREVMSMDVTNGFIQMHMPVKEDGERVIMKICGKVVDCLVEIELTVANVIYMNIL